MGQLAALSNFALIGVQPSRLNIQLKSEQFSSDRVMVVLEWTSSNLLSQYPQLLQNIIVDVAADLEAKTMLVGRNGVRLILLYNMPYNVSIIQLAICDQLSQAAFIELNYSS